MVMSTSTTNLEAKGQEAKVMSVNMPAPINQSVVSLSSVLFVSRQITKSSQGKQFLVRVSTLVTVERKYSPIKRRSEPVFKEKSDILGYYGAMSILISDGPCLLRALYVFNVLARFQFLQLYRSLLVLLTHSPALSGIACIALSFVDAHGHPLQGSTQDCTPLQRSENCITPPHIDHFDELTSVVKVDSIFVSSGTSQHNSE